MARVPIFPPRLRGTDAATDVRASLPVVGAGQWRSWAEAAAWLAGRGAQIASFNPQLTLQANRAAVFPIYAEPHKQCCAWLYVLTLVRTGANENIYGHFDGMQGDQIGTWSLDSSAAMRGNAQQFFFAEYFPSMTIPISSIDDVRVEIDSTADGAFVAGLDVFELPMWAMSVFGSADTPMVQPGSCTTHAPIYEPASGRASVNGLGRIVFDEDGGEGLIREARRCCLFSWCNPEQPATSVTSFPGTSQFFEEPPSVLARHLFDGTVLGEVTIAALAMKTGANNGELRTVAASGDTSTITITATSPTWVTGTLDVDTEDLSLNAINGGLRGSTRDTLDVQMRATGANTDVQVFAYFVIEAE